MCVRSGIWSVLALTVLFSACEHEEMQYEDRDAMTIEDIVTAPPTNVITGPACNADEDCDDSLFCLTTTFLLDFVPDSTLEVNGGLCTKLLCSSDEECGGQATCVDGAPLGAEGFQLCLPSCQDLVDCRWQDDWSCFQLPEDLSLGDPGADPIKVCLPDNIVVAAECNDGHCEEEAR